MMASVVLSVESFLPIEFFREVVSLDVELCFKCQFVVLCVVVLVSFHMMETCLDFSFLDGLVDLLC